MTAEGWGLGGGPWQKGNEGIGLRTELGEQGLGSVSKDSEEATTVRERVLEN